GIDQVVACHRARTVHFFQGHHVGYGYHLAPTVLDKYVVDRSRLGTIRNISLYNHAVKLAEPVKVGRKAASVIYLQGLHEVADGNAQLFCFCLVDVQHELRITGIERCEGIGDLLALHQFADKAVGRLCKFIEVATCTILNDKFKATGVTEALDRGKFKEEYTCFFYCTKPLVDQSHHLLDVVHSSTFAVRFHADESYTVVGTVSVGNDVQSGD